MKLTTYALFIVCLLATTNCWGPAKPLPEAPLAIPKTRTSRYSGTKLNSRMQARNEEIDRFKGLQKNEQKKENRLIKDEISKTTRDIKDMHKKYLSTLSAEKLDQANKLVERLNDLTHHDALHKGTSYNFKEKPAYKAIKPKSPAPSTAAKSATPQTTKIARSSTTKK